MLVWGGKLGIASNRLHAYIVASHPGDLKASPSEI